MAKTATLNMRIDPDTKALAEALYSKFGMTLSDAVSIYLHTSVLVGGLPFEVRQPRYNGVTEAALAEVRDAVAGRTHLKSYSSLTDMLADIDSDED
jgi:DNA-damage-inducible protein J